MPAYKVPGDSKAKGLLRIVVADKFTHSQLGEIRELLGIPESAVSGSTKSERASSMIGVMAPHQLLELLKMVFGEGYVRPSPTCS